VVRRPSWNDAGIFSEIPAERELSVRVFEVDLSAALSPTTANVGRVATIRCGSDQDIACAFFGNE
jgi:hypothetical protein